jgi:hypothetical protein
MVMSTTMLNVISFDAELAGKTPCTCSLVNGGWFPVVGRVAEACQMRGPDVVLLALRLTVHIICSRPTYIRVSVLAGANKRRL